MTSPASTRSGTDGHFRILFVCTGNTCRSPMAEAIARRELRERGWSHVEVASAGASTLTGLPASEGARRVADAHGLDLSSHESARLTRDRLEDADLILTMGRGHLAAVEELGGAGKASLLGAFAAGEEGDGMEWAVPDPYGGDEVIYRETFETLTTLVRKALSRLEPGLRR